MPNDRSDAAMCERLEIAGKATKGPWYHSLAAIVGTKKSPEDNDATCICFTEWGCSGDPQANAAHIAASSPDVVREDIEEILRLRGENKLLNSMVMSFAGKAVHETVGGWWTGWKGEKFLTKKAAIMSLIVKVKSELK